MDEKCDSIFVSVWVLYCCSECEILAGARHLKPIWILRVKMIFPLKREKLSLSLTVGKTGFSPFAGEISLWSKYNCWEPALNYLQYYDFPTFSCSCRAPFVHKATSLLPLNTHLGRQQNSSALICPPPFQPTLLQAVGPTFTCRSKPYAL